jgi:acetyltransferase
VSVRNLEFLFRPRSVALIGASKRPRSVGNAALKNLLAGGFEGPILPVNPKYHEVEDVRCWHSIADLPHDVELAVLCTPPATVPGLVAQLGERGTRAIVVLTAGLDVRAEGSDETLIGQSLKAAGKYGVRLLGPNCLGLMVPPIGLNASFSPGMIPSGSLAFVSQSGALATAVADWACQQAIGFSHFVSLGNSADVDFGDLLDYLGADSGTHAILLYIESIRQARKFMSAARAAARNKPVIVLKSGRSAAAQMAAASHTGALASSDLVYDAAIRRAGMLRVHTTEDLFNAVESLARGKAPDGDRVTIVTNGGGPGVMAVDALQRPCQLAYLTQDSLARLDAVLPPTWSRGNPVDLIGDAPPQRYRDALEVLLEAPGSDALVFIHAPTAIVPAAEIAEALVPLLREPRLPVFSCWMGGQAVSGARRQFAGAGIPSFDSPEDAMRALHQRVEFRHNQDLLMQTPSRPPSWPPSSQTGRADDPVATARELIRQVMVDGRELLTEPEAKRVLACFGIPVVETRTAENADAAVVAAAELGYPVALKILSPDITHKSDVGGVLLGISNEPELREAAKSMARRVAERQPKARVEGFTVQPMVRLHGAQELIAGASEDPVFGPIILFGHGGTAVEAIDDCAIALPPLNNRLAADLVSRTRVARLLEGYRDRPPANPDAIHHVLVQIGQLLADLPEVAELDINPLLANADGVVALDARIRVRAAKVPGAGRMAITPYPTELEETYNFGGLFDGQSLTLRPIRPEDEPVHAQFLAQLRPDDVRFRFFGLVRDFSHTQISRYTQIDYDREMAFIAVATNPDGTAEILGVVRAVIEAARSSAEFAIIVRSDIKGRGLGQVLLEKMIRYCRERGLGVLRGQALASNSRMIDLARRLGFTVGAVDGGIVNLELELWGQSRVPE